MSVSCDPRDLLAAAAPFQKCRGFENEVILYLLASINGGSMDPNTLMQAARCMECIPKGFQEEVITSLLCQIASGGGTGNCGWIWGPDQTIYDFIDIDSDANVQTILFPTLVTMGPNFGSFICYGCTALTDLSLPQLASLVGTFVCNSCTALTDLSLPQLVSVGSFFDCDSCTALTDLSLPQLASVGAGFAFYSCTNLVTVDVSSWVPTDGTTIRFDGCALNATSVELILRRCVLAGVTTCTIDLSGGTNAGTASLSPQGQADVVTLGAQLTINP